MWKYSNRSSQRLLLSMRRLFFSKITFSEWNRWANFLNSISLLYLRFFYPFWTNLVQKIKIVWLKWNLIYAKFDRVAHSIYFGPKNCFGANFVQKFKTISSRWNLVRGKIQIFWIQSWGSLVLLWTRNTLFGENLVQKIKTVYVRSKLVPKPISVFRTRWRDSFILLWMRNTLFGQIRSRK